MRRSILTYPVLLNCIRGILADQAGQPPRLPLQLHTCNQLTDSPLLQKNTKQKTAWGILIKQDDPPSGFSILMQFSCKEFAGRVRYS